MSILSTSSLLVRDRLSRPHPSALGLFERNFPSSSCVKLSNAQRLLSWLGPRPSALGPHNGPHPSALGPRFSAPFPPCRRLYDLAVVRSAGGVSVSGGACAAGGDGRALREVEPGRVEAVAGQSVLRRRGGHRGLEKRGRAG